MKSTELNKDEKVICITYSDLDYLLSRQKSMHNTLTNTLKRNNIQYIRDSYISLTENKALLNFIISPIK